MVRIINELQMNSNQIALLLLVFNFLGRKYNMAQLFGVLCRSFIYLQRLYTSLSVNYLLDFAFCCFQGSVFADGTVFSGLGTAVRSALNFMLDVRRICTFVLL